MGNNQHELFRVLDRQKIPLHNNLSERDIRDYVKKRKRSVEAPEVKRVGNVRTPLPVLTKPVVSMGFRTGTTCLILHQAPTRILLWEVFVKPLPVENEKLLCFKSTF